MATPRILKDFNLFGDGNNWQGQIKSITLPEMSRRMAEWEGGGMDGPIEVDMGAELQEMTWVPGGLIIDGLFDTFGSAKHDAAQLRFTGSYESDETGTVVPVEIVIRGRHKKITMGEAAKGDVSTGEISTTLSYFKLTVNSETIVEIDRPGYVFKVRGQDRLAERRRALGL